MNSLTQGRGTPPEYAEEYPRCSECGKEVECSLPADEEVYCATCISKSCSDAETQRDAMRSSDRADAAAGNRFNRIAKGNY